MDYTFVFLPPTGDGTERWAARIRQAVPEIEVVTCASRAEALEALSTARGAFGTMDPELLSAAPGLEWLACPAAGPSPARPSMSMHCLVWLHGNGWHSGGTWNRNKALIR